MTEIISKNKFFILLIAILAIIFIFQVKQKIGKNSKTVVISSPKQSFDEYIMNYQGGNIELFNLKRSPLSEKTINTMNQAYIDLVSLRSNPNIKQNIDQETYYIASSEIKSLKIRLETLAHCKKTDDDSGCKDSKMTSNAKEILKKISNEITENKKIPYKNKREYFYAVCDSIFN